jgi:transcriptional regulator with XRE-family HTH domain
MTQEALAQKIGKHVTTVRNLEGNRSASRRTVEAVALALDVTPESLGFHFRKPLRPRDLSEEQREVVERVLSLPTEELARIRSVLQAVEADRRKKGGR